MFFFGNKRNSINKIGGYIAYYKLEDWWLNSFTEEERSIIKKVYSPLGSTKAIDKGYISSSSQSKLTFLATLAAWFKKPEHYIIGKKILIEVEKHIEEINNILDLHFYYLNCIEVFYRNRNEDEDALNLAIKACKKQIEINKKVKSAFLKDYPENDLPHHTGYKQLAIIYEKQGDIDKALKITKESLANGWNIEDCNSRIMRLEKKLLKMKK